MKGNALFRASQATMAVSVVVFLYEGIAYNFVFLGRILPAVGKQSMILPFGALFNILWGMAMWSYLRAHFADPGSVPERWRAFVRTVGDALPIAPARPEWQPGKATYCKKCDQPRPERAHHCLLCEVCILRMDHHCPWINNCVGFRNHKFFLLLGIYACLTSFVAIITTLPELVHCAGALTRLDEGSAWEPGALVNFRKHGGFISSGDNILEENMTPLEAKQTCAKLPTCKGFTYEGHAAADSVVHVYFKDQWELFGTGWTSFQRIVPEAGRKMDVADILAFLVFGVLAFFVAALLTPMIGTHLPLAMKNITTIEDNYENMPNPFDQGSMFSNLAQVFGAYGPDWLLPIHPRRRLSDGISFAKTDERQGSDGLPECNPDDEAQSEKLWHYRYRVQSYSAPGQEDNSDQGPFGSLARWWNGP